MGDKTKIEWSDATWSPIRARHKETGRVGWHCEHATTGCIHCYAEQMNKRLGTGLPFKPGHRQDIELFLDEKMLVAPLRWRRPRMVFVCSMTDLFGDFVPDEWIDRVFAVMALAPQHQFQVLTKRAGRMRAYLTELGRHWDRDKANALTARWQIRLSAANPPATLPMTFNDVHRHLGCAEKFSYDPATPAWPLPNVWLGISAEDQRRADERIPELLATPAAVRFISAEPLLGPIDLTYCTSPIERHRGWSGTYSPLNGSWWPAVGNPAEEYAGREEDLPRLDWVIVGGESGKAARPMHPDWARSLRDQCTAAGVPFFFKQWGEWLHESQDPLGEWDWSDAEERCALRWSGIAGGEMTASIRLGKARAGRRLDGREWSEMPA